MSSNTYRRQSMAQLYEKLRAQDDDDDTAWLAQFSPDDKFDEPYVPPVRPPPALSSISSASPISSGSPSSSMSDPAYDDESSDDPFEFDSDSDVDPEPLLELPYTELDASESPSLIFRSQEPITILTGPSEPSYVPSVRETETFLPQPVTTPPGDESEDEFETPPMNQLPLPVLPAPYIAYRRTPRSNRPSAASCQFSVLHDINEDAYSESDGNGSEDEYLPSPTLGSRKRYRSVRPVFCARTPVSQKRSAGTPTLKRPRQSPAARNVQAAPGAHPTSSATKNNPWACPYCKWVQRNHRTPDLKRHIRTHTRLQRPAQWVCCGVPFEEAENYNIPADAQPYAWAGETMIGGCRKEFSRRDALKRHLDNDHINCVGNFSAFANVNEDET